MLTVAQSRSLPKTVHQLMLAGAWLMGSAAAPGRDWEKTRQRTSTSALSPKTGPGAR
jgi:hypothetical protein